MMNRRSLLRGLFAAPAIVAASSLMPIKVMAALAPLPKIWGDGIHDDTAALQAFLNAANGKEIYWPAGTLRVTQPIVFDGHYGTAIRGEGHLLADSFDRPGFDGSGNALCFLNCENVHLRLPMIEYV